MQLVTIHRVEALPDGLLVPTSALLIKRSHIYIHIYVAGAFIREATGHQVSSSILLYSQLPPLIIISLLKTTSSISSFSCTPHPPAKNMVFFCFLVDQKRRIRRSKPAAGICSRCGGGASVADIKTETRFCYVPFYWKHWRAIICTFCGAVLKTYANITAA